MRAADGPHPNFRRLPGGRLLFHPDHEPDRSPDRQAYGSQGPGGGEKMTDVAVKNSTLKKSLHLGGTLFLVTAVTGLVLGLVQWSTADAIRAAQDKERAQALMGVMPDAESFRPLALASGADPAVLGVEEGFKGTETVGHCITVSSKGYGGPIDIVVGLTREGTKFLYSQPFL